MEGTSSKSWVLERVELPQRLKRLTISFCDFRTIINYSRTHRAAGAFISDYWTTLVANRHSNDKRLAAAAVSVFNSHFNIKSWTFTWGNVVAAKRMEVRYFPIDAQEFTVHFSHGDLLGASWFDDVRVARLCQRCPHLKVISLRCPLITDVALGSIAQLEHLERLEIYRPEKITNEGVRAFVTTLSSRSFKCLAFKEHLPNMTPEVRKIIWQCDKLSKEAKLLTLRVTKPDDLNRHDPWEWMPPEEEQ